MAADPMIFPISAVRGSRARVLYEASSLIVHGGRYHLHSTGNKSPLKGSPRRKGADGCASSEDASPK